MITRRRILQGAGLAVLSSVVAPTSADAVAPGDIPIIDTHQHLWDLKKFNLPWISPDDKTLGHSHLMPDYLGAAKGLNVVKAVYMEVAVDTSQRQEEAEYIIDLCRQKNSPTVAGVIAGNPDADNFRKYITQFKNSPYIKGIRCGYKSGASADKQSLAGLQLLGELGMSFDFLMGSADFVDAAKVADLCPDTKFIVDHCGNPDPRLFGRQVDDEEVKPAREGWRRGMAELANRKNVVCKMSGIVENAPAGKNGAEDVAPVINFCLDHFGPDRVMFDSNWPVCNKGGSFAGWVNLLKAVVANRPPAEQRKLFHDNAEKFFHLA